MINVDIKIFSKIISSRLMLLIPSVIHGDQVHFVCGREARNNTNRTLLLISHAQRQKIPACLLSVDAVKAFDRVPWYFLRSSLALIGIGPSSLCKIMALVPQPISQSSDQRG